MSNLFRNYDVDTAPVPHIQSLIAGALIVAALFGPIGLMAARMAGY
ncbi:hypothetical protein [Pseudaquidulcibacter saccharophilus]|nr:hypothetical protein [Pseudaquidulcibacter saccharophilus]